MSQNETIKDHIRIPPDPKSTSVVGTIVSKLDTSKLKDETVAGILKTVADDEKNNRGWLGKFLGESRTLPYKIASISIMWLLIAGVIYSFWHPENSLSVKDMWLTISPFITLSAGFLFGNKSNKSIE
jgi:hypothetical protein